MLMLRVAFVSLIAGLLLTACTNQKPFKYQSASEIPDGAGMISGEDGAFILYSNERKDAPNQPVELHDTRRFEAFQVWKREENDMEEEHRQFHEWLEWKEYQKWREQQGD